jgi:hypothetical protein
VLEGDVERDNGRCGDIIAAESPVPDFTLFLFTDEWLRGGCEV